MECFPFNKQTWVMANQPTFCKCYSALFKQKLFNSTEFRPIWQLQLHYSPVYVCVSLCVSQLLTSEAALSWYSWGFPLCLFTALLPGSNTQGREGKERERQTEKLREKNCTAYAFLSFRKWNQAHLRPCWTWGFAPFCSSGTLNGEGLYLCFRVTDWISKTVKSRREFRGTVAAVC